MKSIYTKILFVVSGFIFGIILTGLVLYQYISSQRNQAYNKGFLDGRVDMIKFLGENIKNDTTTNKVIKMDRYYDFKYYRLSVIKINGIQTIQVTGTD